MACTSCGQSEPSVVCVDCNPPVVECAEAQPCVEVISTDCVIYHGDDVLCGGDTVVNKYDNLTTIVESLFTYFCGSIATYQGVDVVCNGFVIIANGDTLSEALTKVSSFVCSTSNGLEEINIFVNTLVRTVTGLNTDNTDPRNPIVRVSVDGDTITGQGTPGDPLVALNADLGSILFVSENGDDLTGEKGNIHKPFATLNAARTAALSGDTIYVFPQVIVYDNRNSNGNAWNGRQAEMNLWKDGITYYFCPGVNIKIYNQTVSGEYLYLFRPNGDAYETCTVRGHLKYEQFGTGADSSNGHIYYFNGLALGTDLGYNFDSEVDYMFTDTTQVLGIERQGVSIVDDAVITKIRIKAREVFKTYSAGNTGAGTWCVIRGGDHQLRYDEIIEKFTNTSGNNLFAIYSFRDNLSKTVINITGSIYSSDNRFFDIRSNVTGGIINYKVNKSYFGIRSAASYIGIIVATWSYATAAIEINLESNFEQIADSNSNSTLFYIANTNHILNVKGDVITKTATTAGHRIVQAYAASIVNINGNIIYAGVGTTTSNTFFVDTESSISLTGNILGNFSGIIAQFQKGFITIKDSLIKPTIASSTIGLLTSVPDIQNHELRLYNCNVILENDTLAAFNASYSKLIVSDSTLVNLSTGGGVTNSVAVGLVQLTGSRIIVPSGDALNVTTQPVTSLGSAVNTSYTAPALDGTLAILTTLTN